MVEKISVLGEFARAVRMTSMVGLWLAVMMMMMMCDRRR